MFGSSHRSLRFAGAPLLGAALATVVAAAPATAAPAYQPDWPGNLIVHYNYQPLPPAGDANVHSSVPPLATRLKPGLDQMRHDLCTDVQPLIDSGYVEGWNPCTSGSGELWAAPLDSTHFALRYTISDIQFSFTYHGSYYPTIDIDAAFEADATIAIGNRSDGDSNSTTSPLSVGSVTASLMNAHVTNGNDTEANGESLSQLVGIDRLHSIENSLDASVSVDAARFKGPIGIADTDLHTVARAVAASEPEAGANNHFTFAARLDGYGDLIVNYGRGQLPGECQRIDPPPANYGLTVECPDDGGHNTLWVSAGTPWQQVATGTTQLYWDPTADSMATWNVCGTNTFGSACGPFSTDQVLSTADEIIPYNPATPPDSSQETKCFKYCPQ